VVVRADEEELVRREEPVERGGGRLEVVRAAPADEQRNRERRARGREHEAPEDSAARAGCGRQHRRLRPERERLAPREARGLFGGSAGFAPTSASSLIASVFAYSGVFTMRR